MKPEAREISVRRTARYYTLGTSWLPESWLVLHGYGQLARRFIELFRPIATDRIVLAPEGLSRFYSGDGPRVGASWMTREHRDAEIADYIALLDCITAEVAMDPSEMTVLGFSQGAHTACRWVAAQTDVKRLILWGSTMPVDLDYALLASALEHGTLTFVCGRNDRYAAVQDLERDAERMRRVGLDPELVVFDGGHEIPPEALVLVAGHSSD